MKFESQLRKLIYELELFLDMRINDKKKIKIWKYKNIEEYRKVYPIGYKKEKKNNLNKIIKNIKLKIENNAKISLSELKEIRSIFIDIYPFRSEDFINDTSNKLSKSIISNFNKYGFIKDLLDSILQIAGCEYASIRAYNYCIGKGVDTSISKNYNLINLTIF